MLKISEDSNGFGDFCMLLIDSKKLDEIIKQIFT